MSKAKDVNETDVYLMVYRQILLGNYPVVIAKKLNISRQALNRYIKRLKDEKIITKVGYGVWEVAEGMTELRFKNTIQNFRRCKRVSVGTTNETNLHSLNIKIPILQGKIYDKEWQTKEKLNNWIPKYKKLNILGGIQIKNNNNKSIMAFVDSRNIKDVNEIDNLAFKVKAYLHEFFKQQGVTLDVMNCETKAIHIGTYDKNSESMLRKGEKYSLNLGKKAEKIFPNDDINAEAWIDGSPYKFTAETNDKEWKREYLSMPFTIRDIKELVMVNNRSTELLRAYSEQIALHLKVEQRQLENQQKMNLLLSKIEKRLRN